MPEGPLGGPRPFVSEEVSISLSDSTAELDVSAVGPAGMDRPAVEASNNAPTSVEEDPENLSDAVKKCIQSDEAQSYVSGLENKYDVNMPDATAYALKKDWCKGEVNAFSAP